MKENVPEKEKAECPDKKAVERLISERNSLLSTGVYSKHDPLIQELDSKISLLQQS